MKNILLAYDSPGGGSGGAPASAEPGTVDNRLSLDPSDDRWSSEVDEWEDGKEYSVTLKVKQISPGEFEVTDMTDSSDSDEKDEPAGEEPTTMNSTTDNPAIKSMPSMKE